MIQNGMPPNVLAVTNTRGLGKWREGALSLEKITFKAQNGVHADAAPRQRSGPLFYNPSQASGMDRGRESPTAMYHSSVYACGLPLKD